MHPLIRAGCILAALCALPLARVDVSHAGAFTVTGTCGAWHAVNNASSGLAVYPSCPWLVVRNAQGNYNTPETANAAWIFEAPGGTAIQSVKLSGTALGADGWQSTIYLQGGTASGAALENCPGTFCPGGSRHFEPGSYGASGANAIIARVRCGRSGGCSNAQVTGNINLWGSEVTVVDWSPPAVGAEGQLAAAGWKSGTVPVVVAASDNVGVKQTRALVDGVPRATAARGCDYTYKVPCPNGPDTLNVPLGGLPDGQHTLTVQGVDSADNIGGSDRAIHVDNTPPVAPEAATIDGGPGWRSENRWAVRWTNPPQRFAPIAGAEYEICPELAASRDPDVAAKARKQCVSGWRSKLGVSEIDDLTVPRPGSWTLRLWLVDAAGNRNPDASVKLEGLGLDPTPPTDVSFADQLPQDPARLRVNARDGVSGIASGSVEVRRRGKRVWRPLPTHVTPEGLTAFVDDEVLARGRYDLRAVAVNGAGLQHGTETRADGKPATIRLPIRRRARLLAGRLVRRCDGQSAHRCRTKVIKRVRSGLRRRSIVRGRLSLRSKPIARQELEFWRRLAMTSARWERIGTARTGRSGRFKFRVPRGPAGRLRVRYPGTAHVRGVNAHVVLHVPARTTMRVSRRNVVNGEYVLFQGRVRRAWIPPEGTLVELQVYTRRRWRTFAQPRASAENGRWEFNYRFEAIRGDVSFRFRARIRRQSNYPFHTGHSRPIRVRVRGL